MSTPMIGSEECSVCYGHGQLHSPGRNGDPMDKGVKCPACDGAGVIDVDLNEYADDDDGDWN